MYTTDRRHGLIHRMHHQVFNTLYNRSLLYNTCWEDPALDRQAMQLRPDSEVLVITSAGCNALDYALDAPRAVHAIDANPRQNAVLELKQAGIRRLEYEDFFQLFGLGRHPRIGELYRQELRPQLSQASRDHWDKAWRWFTHERGQHSFYYHGLSGTLARAVTLFLRANTSLWRWINELMHCRSLEEQRFIYDTHIDHRLISRPLRWTLNRQFTMSMLGVPYPQRQAVKAEHADGVAGFVRACLRTVCRDLPFWNNYFWTLYLRGRYSEDCCPNYLTPQGFQALKGGLVDRIQAHSCTVTHFLREDRQADISHLVLLDHMDWMADAFPAALDEEWAAIQQRARPGAQVLFRSGSSAPTFLDSCQLQGPGGPASLRDSLHFNHDLAAALHRHDRVHTYASFHIASLVGN
jgi:S-adenosylmethionine-diacylglycerol 3-amino-3-carboxypropyl transferase